jgi:hypothetical protein
VKKLIVFAVALLALGFAANSFAVQAEIPADTTAVVAKGGTQVTIGGELRVRGIASNNTRDFNSHVTDGDSFANGFLGYGFNGKPEKTLYDYRYRLNIKAQVTKNTIGFIQLDGSGGNGTDDNGEWGSQDNPVVEPRKNGGSFRMGDQKLGAVRISQAWIQHSGSGLLGIPAYIKIGHQPITVGAGVFYSHTYNNDDAIVAGITPIKGLDLTLLTVKLRENNDNAADDQDLYSFMINYAINKNYSIGLDISLLQSQHTSNVFGTDVAPFSTGFKGELWNLGLNAKATPIPNLKLYITGDFQFGQAKNNDLAFTADYRGWAVTVGGSYKFAPVTIGLDFGYGSGDSKWDNKYTTFMTSQSNTVHYAFVYDYHTVNAAGNRTGGLQNTMFAKIKADADVMKNLNIGGSVILLNAAKKAILYQEDGVDYAMWYTNNRYIGTEVDATLTYQIDKGLKYFVEAGYLFAGKFWRGPMNGDYSHKVNDPWVVRHGIQLNF